MKIGLDFGTTHTTAAFYDGGNLTFIPLDPQNHDPQLLRSMIYITKQHDHLLGFSAVDRYLNDNTGRSVKHERKHVGTVENVFANISGDEPLVVIRDVYVEEDIAAPGRLIQSIKTGLRDPEYKGTNIYDKFFTVQELIALLLSHVKERAEAFLQSGVNEVVLGHPVKFSDDAAAHQQAKRHLQEAATLAGFQDIAFEQEPIAAAHFYLRDVSEAQTALIFDFGGGTLDLTIIRTDGNTNIDVLGTQGVLLGGDDLDSAIMRGRLAKNFGEGSMYDHPRRPVPRHIFGHLEQWQTIPELSKEDNMKIIRYGQGGDNPAAFKMLECLSAKNYGFALFERIERTKRALSAELQTCFEMQVERIDITEMITRNEFERYISKDVKRTRRGINQILADANLLADDIDVVVTTGGSSMIPVFQQLLHQQFPNARLAQSDTFGSVVAGLAA